MSESVSEVPGCSCQCIMRQITRGMPISQQACRSAEGKSPVVSRYSSYIMYPCKISLISVTALLLSGGINGHPVCHNNISMDGHDYTLLNSLDHWVNRTELANAGMTHAI